MTVQIRLDKFLTDTKIGSRSEVKAFIKKGWVLVDEVQAKKPEEKIDPNKSKVFFQGKQVKYHKFHYQMLYKPSGVITATFDKNKKTVLDLIPEGAKMGLFPVGRLDKDTEGLLLLTNDGELAHKLLSPKKHADKLYYAEVDGVVTKEEVDLFLEGIVLKPEGKTMPAVLNILEPAERSKVTIQIQEGKYHQIKRMFEHTGKKVVYLKRLSMGPIVLDETLSKGESRDLTNEEIELLIEYKLAK